MSVVLPAPLGPSRPVMPSPSSRLTPASACVEPSRLCTSVGVDGGGHGVLPRSRWSWRRARTTAASTAITANASCGPPVERGQAVARFERAERDDRQPGRRRRAANARTGAIQVASARLAAVRPSEGSEPRRRGPADAGQGERGEARERDRRRRAPPPCAAAAAARSRTAPRAATSNVGSRPRPKAAATPASGSSAATQRNRSIPRSPSARPRRRRSRASARPRRATTATATASRRAGGRGGRGTPRRGEHELDRRRGRGASSRSSIVRPRRAASARRRDEPADRGLAVARSRTTCASTENACAASTSPPA